jgi:hypothetical protein
LVNRGELALASVFAALGALWVWRAVGMPVWGDSFAPDSGFLPLIYGALLFALSMAVAAHCVLAPAPAVSDNGGIRKPLYVLGALTAAVAALPLAGFAISVFALLYFLYAWVERLPQLSSIVVSAAITGALHVVFKTWLGVPLP